jgi:hypothetical protein
VDDTSNLIVFLLVLASRLLVPLFIPRFPLPAIIAALLLDAVDQTVFQIFTDLNLDNYQGYDKALDVYYLTIAYLSTLRNWTNLTAVSVGRFLLFYRLVGVLLFELFDVRALLLIFPNTFEYFFIAYEAVNLRWDPRRMSRPLVNGMAAFIWIFIKLPQEWWIHIAQLDFTDTVRKYPALLPAIVVALLALAIGAWWAITRKLPPADHRPSLDADDYERPDRERTLPARLAEAGRLFDFALLEKVALVALVSVIFAQILPEVSASGLGIAVSVALLIIANTAISEWLVRRGRSWETAIRQFVAMAVVNGGMTLAAWLVLGSDNDDLHLGNTLFFLLLLTLLITLYDRYRPSYVARRRSETADTGPGEMAPGIDIAPAPRGR